MHVIVVGAGAIGTLYGGWLRAGGIDVSFVARGPALEALRTTGPILVGAGASLGGMPGGMPGGRLCAGPVDASADPAELRRADAVILTVKLYDLPQAARIAATRLIEGGLVVGLQNGISAAAILGETFSPGQVMVGPVYSAARLSAPAVVEYSGARHRVIVGNPAGVVHRAAGELVAGWRRAGIEAEVGADIVDLLWAKFLGFATNAALTCLSRQPAGVVYQDPDLLDLARLSIAEIVAVARAEGVTLPADAEAATIRLLRSFPPDMVASMRHDLDAGRRLELDDITGAIVRLGRRHGIATPLHATAYACLKPYRDGRPSPHRSVASAAS